MGELRSTEDASKAWTKLCVVSLGSRPVVYFIGLRVDCLYSMHSQHLSSLVFLPTGAGRQTSSPVTVLSKKQAKEEEERLTRELQLVTQERNELRDRLIYVTEGAMNKRYALLQMLWCSSGVNATLVFLRRLTIGRCIFMISLGQTSCP